MQYTSPEFTAALEGSVSPAFSIEAFYGGEPTLAEPLNAADWSVEIDGRNGVAGTCNVTVADPDGALVPRKPADPLAPFGQEINIKAGIIVGGVPELVSLGWFDLFDATPEESWKWLRKKAAFDARKVVASGASIPLAGRGRMDRIDASKFQIVETPKSGNVWTEIVRLVDGLIPVEEPEGFSATLSATAVTYGDSRLQAITDVAASAGMAPWITPDGSFTLRPLNFTGQTWEVDSGPLATFGRYQQSMSKDRVKNSVKVVGTDANGNPITVVKDQLDGPFAVAGPLGRRTADEVNDPLLTTLAKVTARAAELLAAGLAGEPQTLDVPTVLHYGLEVGDVLVLNIPTSTTPVSATIVRIVYPQRGTMTVTVTLPNGW